MSKARTLIPTYGSTPMHYYLDRHTMQPVAIEYYEELPGHINDERRLFVDKFIILDPVDPNIDLGTITVSTVFLAINHSWIPDSAPVLYETMIFVSPVQLLMDGEDSHDQYQDRYMTYQESQAGHQRAVDLVINLLNSGSRTYIRKDGILDTQ